MRRIRGHLLEMVAGWDTPTRIAMTIAVGVLVVMLGLFQFGGEALRTPALVGTITTFTVIEVIVLWGNRWMVTPFSRAQKFYRDGDFRAVVALLEPRAAAGEANVPELTLLGNTFRQMGDLAQSGQYLTQALEVDGEHGYFPLYGYGRTLMMSGDYAGATDALDAALAQGAPQTVAVDLAEAHARAGDLKAMQSALAQAQGDLEPFREVMRARLLGQEPPRDALEAGLPYWVALAERFEHTPYGAALREDVAGWKAKMGR